LALTSTVPLFAAAEPCERYAFANGIAAAVYTPERILAHCTSRDHEDRLILRLPDGYSYILIEDTSDPAVVNKGDGSFHPMRTDDVVRAIEEIDVGNRDIDCEIEVYILPYPRLGFLRSTASGSRVFLCPGVHEPGPRVTAYTVTHELGHIFQHRHVPEDDTDRWGRYLDIRGLSGDPRYGAEARHRDRPREIFAEDFRYLFGGDDARYSGTIENPDLLLPDRVTGLEEFMISLLSPAVATADNAVAPMPGEIVSAVNYPNPFNPSTTIELSFNGTDAPRDAILTIHRADGSLVTSVHHGEAAGAVYRATWDGRTRDGSAAPTGVYFYRFRAGGRTATGKMLLIR
jgi:hypothetical protein